MNFLAHTLFADGDPMRIAGQFCGDFVRGSDLSAYPKGIRQGIRRHRRIDAFTDSHPAVIESHNLFKPPLRRFAGIITDVVFDHVLALQWQRYCETPLQQHVETVHNALNEHEQLLPPALQRFSRFIQRENVLLGNLHYQGVEVTLQRLSKRSDRFTPLAVAADVAKQHQDEIGRAFHAFFPEMLALERTIAG